MNVEKVEEILNDPGNHAILKQVASEGETELDELAEATGINEDRLKEKSRLLENQELLKTDKSQVPTVLKILDENRETLRTVKERINEFHEEKSQKLIKKTKEEKELIEKAVKNLQERKQEVPTLKEENKMESRIKTLENARKKIEDADTSKDLLEAYSLSHRALRITGFREENFVSFNPWRKIKTSKKIQGILDQKPEKEHKRMFFGNRWLKESRLS